MNLVLLFKKKFSLSFSRWTWVSWYQNVSILDFSGSKDDGGGRGKWIIRRAKLQWNRHTNKPTPSFLHVGCPSCRPTYSVKKYRRELLTICLLNKFFRPNIAALLNKRKRGWRWQ